jgi:hypothetical protein
MRIAALLLCVFALAACGDDTPKNDVRFVDQDRLDNPIVPLQHVDEAVQTEAMTRMNLIHQQVKLTVASGADPATLYSSIIGSMNATKLAKIGLTESDLKGNYYKAGDFSIVIVGKTMTISAAESGTRGRVEPKSFKLP